jgi:hypothetical protein
MTWFKHGFITRFKHNVFCFQNFTPVFKHSIVDIWISQNVVDADKFLCEFKQRVIDCFVSEAVAFFEDSPKCNFYWFKLSNF